MPTIDTPTAAGATNVLLNQRSLDPPYYRQAVGIQGDENPGKAIGFDDDGVLTAIALPSGAVSVKSFGAIGNGIANDTVAIQAAIDSGRNIDLVGGSYRVSGLTQSTNSQHIVSTGGASRLIKNANGTILASTGSGVVLENILFFGDAVTPTFTGDNVTFAGENCALINCGSQWAHGRAVKATGGHFQILGTASCYQTADATATGYDIELGVSGTTTNYSQLEGVYSSQPTGGILITDGSVKIIGGQFGKLSFIRGAAASTGGTVLGARILGNVRVEGLTIFSGNTFGAIVVTFAAGTSQCVLDKTNVFSIGATFVNLGNANNVIEQNVSVGSNTAIKYGATSDLGTFTVDPWTGKFTFPSVAATALVGASGLIGADPGYASTFQVGGTVVLKGPSSATQFLLDLDGINYLDANNSTKLRVGGGSIIRLDAHSTGVDITGHLTVGGTGADITGNLTVGGGSAEVTTVGQGFILKSPDGTRYRIQVANGGALSTTPA
jgi:hypothetical protein